MENKLIKNGSLINSGFLHKKVKKVLRHNPNTKIQKLIHLDFKQPCIKKYMGQAIVHRKIH